MNRKQKVAIVVGALVMVGGGAWFILLPTVELRARVEFRREQGLQITNLDSLPWKDVRVRIRTTFRNEIGFVSEEEYRAELGTLMPGTHLIPDTAFRNGNGGAWSAVHRGAGHTEIRARIGDKRGYWESGD